MILRHLFRAFFTHSPDLCQVFMHEARREKTWEPGSKRRGCDGAKEELRKLGALVKLGALETEFVGYPLVMTNIAMENHHFE